MYAGLEALDAILKEKKVRHEFTERGERQMIVIPFTGKQQTTAIQCVATSDLPDIALRVPQYLHIPIEKRKKAMEEINRMNTEFRYVCFALDGDNDVQAQVDIPQSVEPVGEVLWTAVTLMTRVLEACYPRFMKLIWGD